jgi:peroxiredoxin Q/BCP
LLEKGALAPAVSGLDQDGKSRSVADVKGRFLVVYFYPKDGTPGCTAEACAFRDAWDRYDEAGVAVYGVSADDVASHKTFAEEHQLTFPLIADPDGAWSDAFGVGKFLGFTERVTFLIDPDGRVAATYPDVDPGVHASDLLRDVAALKR